MTQYMEIPRWIKIGKALSIISFWIFNNKENKSKILIIRTDGIGDLLLFSGAFKQIKRIFPNKTIELVVRRGRDGLVDLCPYIDYIHVFPSENASRIKLLFRRILFFARLCASNYEIIIQPMPHPDTIALQLIVSLKAKQKIGFTGNLANQTSNMRELLAQTLDTVIEVSENDKWIHQSEYVKKVCKAMGCSIPDDDVIWPEIYLSEDDIKWWEKVYIDESLDSFIKIVISPDAATTQLKIWPIERYVEVARKIIKEFKTPVSFILIGAKNGKEMAAWLRSHLSMVDQVKVINLCGSTSLREAASVIKFCDLYLGIDSFALHTATTFGVRTVGIIGGGHMRSYYPWGDYRKNIGVFNEMECWGCYWQCSQSFAKCVTNIQVEDVLEITRYQLERIVSNYGKAGYAGKNI